MTFGFRVRLEAPIDTARSLLWISEIMDTRNACDRIFALIGSDTQICEDGWHTSPSLIHSEQESRQFVRGILAIGSLLSVESYQVDAVQTKSQYNSHVYP